MPKISSIVGKMPFAGKSVVENAALSAVCERTSIVEKTAKAARAIGFLSAFACAHGIQAKMGAYDVVSDCQDLLGSDATFRDVIELGVSSAYTLANAAVTYTQFQIAGRVGANYYNFLQRIDNGGQLADEDFAYTTRRPDLLQVAATLGGQMLFMHFYDKA